MKQITVYQSEYQPTTFKDVGEDYKVTVLERGSLKVEASGVVSIFNAHAWHSVEIYDKEVDRG